MRRPCAVAAIRTAALTLALAVAAGCGRVTERPQAIVLVVVDALRADRLGCYGYRRRPTSPRLDAFAASATRFVHAISSTPWTLPSMATLFTGLYPSVHGATSASDIGRWLTDRRGFEPVATLGASRITVRERTAHATHPLNGCGDGRAPRRPKHAGRKPHHRLS